MICEAVSSRVMLTSALTSAMWSRATRSDQSSTACLCRYMLAPGRLS